MRPGASQPGTEPTELLERASFAVMHRSGVDEREVEAALRGKVAWLGAPIIDLSGTMLRDQAPWRRQHPIPRPRSGVGLRREPWSL